MGSKDIKTVALVVVGVLAAGATMYALRDSKIMKQIRGGYDNGLLSN